MTFTHSVYFTLVIHECKLEQVYNISFDKYTVQLNFVCQESLPISDKQL